MKKKRVLILCTGNSCRSQIAEGVLRHYGSEFFEVFSAGSEPSKVNETAIRVMREIGIDISNHRSKHVNEFVGLDFDYVITVCDHADKACPAFFGKAKRFHWPFPDPPHREELTDHTLNEFRRVRDLIHDQFRQTALKGDI